MPFQNPTAITFESRKSSVNNSSSISRPELSPINSFLQLFNLVVGLGQKKQESDEAKKKRRDYRHGQGKANRVKGNQGGKTFSFKEIKKRLGLRQQQLQKDLERSEAGHVLEGDPKKSSSQELPNHESSSQELPAQELQIPKPQTTQRAYKILTKEQIIDYENSAKSARGSEGLIYDANYEGCDLSALNFDDLKFRNCNFKNAKMPLKMQNVGFWNDCNLEGSDWSGGVYKYVTFGSLRNEDEKKLIDNVSLRQLDMNQVGGFFDDKKVVLCASKPDSCSAIYDNNVDNHNYNVDGVLTSPTIKVLNAKNINLSGSKFEGFYVNDANFAGSSFQSSVFLLKFGLSKNYFDINGETAIDLTGSKFQFFDKDDNFIAESRDIIALDLSSVDEKYRGLIGLNGVCSKRYFDKMASGLEIVFAIDIKKEDDSIKLSSEISSKALNEALQGANKFFGRYGIRFVSLQDLKGSKPDFKLTLNVNDKDKDFASVDVVNPYSLGLDSAVIDISDDRISRPDFRSTFLHELGHILLFKHPMGNAPLNTPSLMSYLSPMGRRVDDQAKILANNFIPIVEFTIDDQKVFEECMGFFGRRPHINSDLYTKIDAETLGVRSLYNPNSNYKNIAEISPDILLQNSILIMNASDALSYCLDKDQYKCMDAKTLDNSQALVVMNNENGMVSNVLLLGGPNNYIKIGENLLNIDSTENGFGILKRTEDGQILIDKFQRGQNYEKGNALNFASKDLIGQLSHKTDSSNAISERVSKKLGWGFLFLASAIVIKSVVSRTMSRPRLLSLNDAERDRNL